MIIPQSKTVEIASKTATGAGFETFRVDLEYPVGVFTLSVQEDGTSGRVAVRAYDVGDNTSVNRILKYDSGPLPAAQSEPLQFEILAGGGVIIELEYTRALTYSLRGRSKQFAKQETDITVATTPEEARWREAIESSLSEVNEQLGKMLFHLSVISGIDEDC